MSEAMGLYYLYTIYIEEGLALQQITEIESVEREG